MKKRILQIAVALCMVLMLLPVSALATDNSEMQTCTCEAACMAEAMNTDCPVCDAEGATIENCGKYEAPVEETEPEQTAIEKVQALIDALPIVEELEDADEATVNVAYEAAQDAYDALEALNPEEQEQITGVEKLMTLMKWFNEKTSMTDDVYYYDNNNVHGIEQGKTYCGDTYFTVDIPAEHLTGVDYYHPASGTYPVLTPDEDGRYKLDAGLGLIDVTVRWDNRINTNGHIIFHNITINADHADIDKDHNCENGCGKTVGTHEDADRNHICDYECKEAIGTCEDAYKDHKCDYGCGKDFGTCEDAYKDHKCDYGCGKDFGTCEDAYKNHKCDYGCGKDFGTCEDADKDHKCDYGCGKDYGTHEEGTNYDHKCDYCGGTVSNHNFGKDGKCECGAVQSSAFLPTWQGWELIDKIVAANKKKDEPVAVEPEVTETEPVEEVEPAQVETTWENPFSDVTETDTFYEAVKFAYENGYMNGMSENTFAPNEGLTRAMLVTVLYRAAGAPVMNDANPFTDVADDAWYHNAVVWARSIGLVNGITETEFAPENLLTREQLVTIFYRYANFLGYDVSIGEETNILSYEDFADIAEYAIPAMQWACGAGLIENIDGNILPKESATRALVAMVLFGFYA